MRIYLLGFIVLLLFSCRKEKVVTVTVTQQVPLVHTWQLDSGFIYQNKILLASAPMNDSVLNIASAFTLWPVNGNQLNGESDGILVDRSPLFDFFPPSLDKQIGVTLIDSNHLRVFSTTTQILNNGGNFFYSPIYTTNPNSTKGFPVVYSPIRGYPIINSKYILAPVEMDYTGQKMYLNLLTVNTSNDNSNNPQHISISLGLTQNIILTPDPTTTGFLDYNYFSASYFGKFFIYLNDQFFRVDTLGNVKAFGNSPSDRVTTNGAVAQMFTINNYLFALSGAKTFVSQDEGETWTLFSDTGNDTALYQFVYKNVGTDVYAIANWQIFHVTLTGNALNFQEVADDGLETSLITSINKAGKSVVVITLSGLYYRDTAGFNNAKKIK